LAGGQVHVLIERSEFDQFLAASEPRIRRALIAAYGSDRGREAAAEALAYAWENWDQVRAMDHPVAYLYRVGQSKTRPPRRRVIFEVPDQSDPWFEPRLGRALGELTEHQRIAVVLVKGFDWSLGDIAELCEIRVTTVQTHLERGLARLRAALAVV
jgi:DNA-directed RNA polymerase specialized sigma24 family protein